MLQRANIRSGIAIDGDDVGPLTRLDIACLVLQPEQVGTIDRGGLNGSLPFECGTLNEVGICGVGRTLEMFLEVGPRQIEEYLLFLISYLRTSLEEHGYNVHSPRDPGETSAILVCDHPNHPAEELHQRLESQNILVSVRLERLRIAPHFYNTTEEIDALVSHLSL